MFISFPSISLKPIRKLCDQESPNAIVRFMGGVMDWALLIKKGMGFNLPLSGASEGEGQEGEGVGGLSFQENQFLLHKT